MKRCSRLGLPDGASLQQCDRQAAQHPGRSRPSCPPRRDRHDVLLRAWPRLGEWHWWIDLNDGRAGPWRYDRWRATATTSRPDLPGVFEEGEDVVVQGYEIGAETRAQLRLGTDESAVRLPRKLILDAARRLAEGARRQRNSLSTTAPSPTAWCALRATNTTPCRVGRTRSCLTRCHGARDRRGHPGLARWCCPGKVSRRTGIPSRVTAIPITTRGRSLRWPLGVPEGSFGLQRVN